jgi:hypothetical protein
MPHDSMGPDPRRDYTLPNRASTLFDRMRPLCSRVLEDSLHSGTEARQLLQSGDCRCKQLRSCLVRRNDNQGRCLGSGNTGLDHRFVWPAFALIVGLAIWRLVVREASARVGLSCYLALMLIASGTIAAAGYWGGELILGGG